MKEVRGEERELKQYDGGSREVVDKETEKPEFLDVIKSGKGIISLGRKGPPLTPAPTWKTVLNDENGGDPIYCGDNGKGLTLSARKLAANLWELQNVVSRTPPADSARKMKRGVAETGGRSDKSLGFSSHLLGPSHSPVVHHPTSTHSLRGQMAASLIGHQKMIDGNDDGALPDTPATFCSSLEIAAYDQATPCSSLDIKGRPRELSSNLKTSTELLKVLNRIWVLEEQHALNLSKIKALKLERDHARARVQDLILEQQEDRKHIDELMKQFTEEKLITKSRVHERIKASVQSVGEELDDERRLRRRSESLHRKLARDLVEVKMTLSKAVKELERERKTRLLLEDLCDEFAKGVADYEQELHGLKQKYEKEPSEREDRFIVHIAEAWLDERVQMKLAEEDHDSQDNMVVDGLQCEIGSLLRRKQSRDLKVDMHAHGVRKDDWLRCCSVESVQLNQAASGPQFAGDDDSVASESDGFDINRSVEDAGDVKRDIYRSKVIADLEAAMKPNHPQPKVVSQERVKGRSSCSFVGQLEDKVSCSKSGSGGYFADRTTSIHAHNVDEDEADSSSQIEISICPKSDNRDMQDDYQDVKHSQMQRGEHVNQLLLLPNGSMFHSENKHKEDGYSLKTHSFGARDQSSGGVHDTASPVQKWACYRRSPDQDLSESSSKKPCPSKESTLKAKLLEARLEGQQDRLRLARGT